VGKTSSRRLNGALDWSGYFEDEKNLLTSLEFEPETMKPIAPVTIPTIFLTIGPVATLGSFMTDGYSSEFSLLSFCVLPFL